MRNKQKIHSRTLIFCSFLCALGGCIYNDEPMPKITYDRTENSSTPLKIPTTKTQTRAEGNIPKAWLPASLVEKKWTAIVIHHSGTKTGNAAIFDKWHREGNHWEGVGYNFVIGNGTDSANGEVEVTFRWRNQKTGAHCGGTPANWANKNAIGICLVGNFNRTVPTLQQMQSLEKLIRFLQNRYGIPKRRIYGHNSTPGVPPTDCPGKKFPMAKLKSMLDF
ncbi:MAG: N-acetylmuramoyl-L-alanine amidase [Planctomycetota bacterium]|nr:MAG: N-acetylmuramoyl-L-alanine amidase [Planctomycetota bacterium]